MDNQYPESNVQKLALPGGLRVGIKNLDGIIRDVAGMGLIEDESVGKELLERVKAGNFIAAGVEREYTDALLAAYRKKLGLPETIIPVEHRKPWHR